MSLILHQDNIATILPLPVRRRKNIRALAASRTIQALDRTDMATFVQMSTNHMVVLTAVGRITRANTVFRQLFDLSVSREFLTLFHSQDRAYIQSTLSVMETYTEGLPMNTLGAESEIMSPIHCEGRMITANGSVRFMRWTLSCVGNMIYACGQDLTAFKAHENALYRKEQQLCETESIAGMGHWRWEIGHADMLWSTELYNIFGVKVSDFRPSLESLCALMHAEDSDRLLQVFQRAMIEQASYELDLRLSVSHEDEHHIIRCEGRCEVDQDGDAIALYGIMQDITARVLYERDLRMAKEEAERACASKSQFLANMSHELRTPLNAIIGFSEIMQSQLLGPIGNAKYCEYVNGIHESGQHLLSLISDILDMSKIQAGKYKLTLEEVNLAKLMRLSAHMMEGKAQEARVTLFMDTNNATHETIAQVDRRAVMQIILNLLSNAIKFTLEGGEIHLSCITREDDGVELHVRDTGIGIPSDRIHHITKPFEQVDAAYTRQHEGSGLGLSITKDLVDLHGGRLSITSTLGVGTTVIIWLPIKTQNVLQQD